MKKRRKNTARFLVSALISFLLFLTVQQEEPKVPGQQGEAVCYNCNDHYADKNPLDDNNGNN